MKSLSDEEAYRIDNFTHELISLKWHDLCRLSICAMKRVLPIWDQEVKLRYFIYADHVCGMRHKISKKTITDYIAFLENNPQLWGTENVKNNDILELWVALTDFEFSISPKATSILIATYELMMNICDTSHIRFFIETFARITQLFDDWNSFENFFTLVKSDFQSCTVCACPGIVLSPSSSPLR
jgi:hypothetical protein